MLRSIYFYYIKLISSVTFFEIKRSSQGNLFSLTYKLRAHVGRLAAHAPSLRNNWQPCEGRACARRENGCRMSRAFS